MSMKQTIGEFGIGAIIVIILILIIETACTFTCKGVFLSVDWMSTISFWADIATALGVIMAAVGLWFTYKQLKQSQNSTDIDIAVKMMDEIQGLHTRMPKETRELKGEELKEELSTWDSLFFNRVELFCLLVNKKLVKEPHIQEFYDPLIEKFYEEVYQKHYIDLGKDKEESFEEFKERYNEIKRKAS